MAKRNSMSTARSSRNRNPVSARRIDLHSDTEDAAPDSPFATKLEGLEAIVSTERRRLIKAEAVLDCVAFALLYEDWLEGPNRPSFTDAVAAARDLVKKALGRFPWAELTELRNEDRS